MVFKTVNNNMTDKLQQQEEYGPGLIQAIFLLDPPKKLRVLK